MMNKVLNIFLNCIPILLMIAFIPFIKNDYLLTGIYVLIIFASFLIKYNKKEWLFFVFGFIVMIIAEYLFVSNGVETFTRNSFFGFIPLWLPFLWGYAFVAMKRAIVILR